MVFFIIIMTMNVCNVYCNSCGRTMLNYVERRFRFCFLSLLLSIILIIIEEGPQQGDPLGPMLFCLTIHPLLLSLDNLFMLGSPDCGASWCSG